MELTPLKFKLQPIFSMHIYDNSSDTVTLD